MEPFFNRTPASFDYLLQQVRYLSLEDKRKMIAEIEKMTSEGVVLNDEVVKHILRFVRPYMSKILGKYTHNKVSEDWAFYGLAFTRNDIGYVFGLNAGFFNHSDTNLYSHVGMNVLVKTNGTHQDLRLKWYDFFRENLKNWINQSEDDFFYPVRQDRGVVLARYAQISDFSKDEDLLMYIKDSILQLRDIYQKIIGEAELFEGIVRAAPRWNESIVNICKTQLNNESL